MLKGTRFCLKCCGQGLKNLHIPVLPQEAHREQWRKFLSIAYGSFDDTESAFVIHTYLSMLAKVLAYEVLSNDDFIDDEEMKSILNGSIFHQHNIRNFVDNDFYHWVHGENHYHQLKKTFRLITQEMSNFDFNKVDKVSQVCKEADVPWINTIGRVSSVLPSII